MNVDYKIQTQLAEHNFVIVNLQVKFYITYM